MASYERVSRCWCKGECEGQKHLPTDEFCGLVSDLTEILANTEPVMDELIAWINTDMIGCIDVEARGTAILQSIRNTLAKGG